MQSNNHKTRCMTDSLVLKKVTVHGEGSPFPKKICINSNDSNRKVGWSFTVIARGVIDMLLKASL